MKRTLIMLFLLAANMLVMAQAKIEFEKLTHDFGTVSEPTVKCTYTFTNKGDAPLVIHQVTTSCGCTTTEYTKTPVKPGESGTIVVSYTGKFNGDFSKQVTVKTNGAENLVRLYLTGNMQAKSLGKSPE